MTLKEGDTVSTFRKCIKNILITAVCLVCAFGLSLLFQYIFDVQEHITTVFVFAVFLVSIFTEGYLYGVFAAFVGTAAVNYAFTFPYFSLNFTIPVNLISGIIKREYYMLILTAAQNTQPDYIALAIVAVLAVIVAIIGIIILATKLVNYLFSE